jgi:RNA-directed DNA polymerase
VLRRADGAKGEAASGSNREGESTDAERRGGAARSGVEGPVMGPERRGCVVRPWPLANWKREEPVDEAKPFKIPKREVWEAFKRVKANQGAAGVDGQSIAEFEANLSGNLYKLWNRLSSGSYLPPPVRRVEIPKASGGTRTLGIPTHRA